MNAPKAPERNRYGFENMEVNGFKQLELRDRAAAIRARSAMHAIGTRSKFKFISEISYDDGVKDIRYIVGAHPEKVILKVWRVE